MGAKPLWMRSHPQGLTLQRTQVGPHGDLDGYDAFGRIGWMRQYDVSGRVERGEPLGPRSEPKNLHECG